MKKAQRKPVSVAQPPADEDMKQAFDEQLGYRIILLSNIIGKPFFSGLDKKFSIALNEWRIILVLKFHPNISATDIATMTGLQKMAVSRSIQALLKRGYIGLGQDPVDGRRKLINLTRSGKAVFTAVFPTAIKRDQQVKDCLTEQEQKTMLQLLNKIITAMQAMDTA